MIPVPQYLKAGLLFQGSRLQGLPTALWVHLGLWSQPEQSRQYRFKRGLNERHPAQLSQPDSRSVTEAPGMGERPKSRTSGGINQSLNFFSFSLIACQCYVGV